MATEYATEIHISQCKNAMKVELVSFLFPLIFAFFLSFTSISLFFAQFFVPAFLVFILIVGVIAFIILTTSGIISAKLRWDTKYYIINSERIDIVDGIFGKRHRAQNLKGMIGMQIQQPFLGKLFNYGTISIKFMGNGDLNIRNVSDPEKYMDLIQEMFKNGKVAIS